MFGVRKSPPVGARESGKHLNVFVQDKYDRITFTDEKESCLSPTLIGWCKRQKFRDEDETDELKYEVQNVWKNSALPTHDRGKLTENSRAVTSHRRLASDI